MIERGESRVVDLARTAAEAVAAGGVGAVWSLASADLNLNLLRFAAGDGVAAHVNAEVDVMGVVIAGEGVLELDGREERLVPGMLFFLPRGARRGLRALSDDFAYLSCHRRRAGLMPTRRGG